MKLYTLDGKLIKEYSRIAPKNFTGITECEYRIKEYYKNGYRHRQNGPAVEWPDGSKQWWVNNKLHRLDGPAVIKQPCFDLPLRKYWFIEGKNIHCKSDEHFELYIAIMGLKGLI